MKIKRERWQRKIRRILLLAACQIRCDRGYFTLRLGEDDLHYVDPKMVDHIVKAQYTIGAAMSYMINGIVVVKAITIYCGKIQFPNGIVANGVCVYDGSRYAKFSVAYLARHLHASINRAERCIIDREKIA